VSERTRFKGGLSRGLSPPPSAVVFDLDGTLIDSRRDLATAVNRMRAAYGLGELKLSEVVTMVGEGARNLVARALGRGPEAAAGGGDAETAARLDEALGRFAQHYGEVCLDTTRPYPGVPEMLAAVAARYPLAVYSNKPERFTRFLLERLGLERFFAHVLGGDSLATRKPDPAGLRLLAGRLGAPLAEVLLVGDSRVDAAAAAAAGCRFALVTWGFATPEEADRIRATHRPELVAADPPALAAALLGGVEEAGTVS
jgi:phosphoglycolate phosphatase